MLLDSDCYHCRHCMRLGYISAYPGQVYCGCWTPVARSMVPIAFDKHLLLPRIARPPQGSRNGTFGNGTVDGMIIIARKVALATPFHSAAL